MSSQSLAYLGGGVQARVARADRGEGEEALDSAGWPWARRVSLWLDALLMLEENRTG